jgi:hypothetical protein
MIARDPAGIQKPDTSRGSCHPVGHPCLYLMSTSDQRSSCDDEPRTVRTVAAAVKFAEPASQVARLAAALRDKRRSAGVG